MTVSPFATFELAAADAVFGIKRLFLADRNLHKIDLSIGVYQTDRGRIEKMQVLQAAEQSLWQTFVKSSPDYLPIDGLEPYLEHSKRLLFGEQAALVDQGRVVTVQSLGGTGALRYAADLLRRYYPASTVYISNPTWPNHRAIFERAGFRVETYPYYISHTKSLDFEALADTLAHAPTRSIVLLHACCHNPTGIDLTLSQWHILTAILASREAIPVVDIAYQGLGDDLETDALPIRRMAEAGLSFLIAQSFSKTFSLYNRRCGALSIVTANAEEARNVLSQIKTDIRANVSNPPVDGAEFVALILSDQTLRTQWVSELASMRDRISRMRSGLLQALTRRGRGAQFEHIARQKGMFSYSGLSKEQVIELREHHSIYILESGRICIAALTDQNLEYIADGIAAVTNTDRIW